DPVARAVLVDLDHRRLLARIVVPEDLDETPVAPRARIGHHHAVVRLLGGPGPSQPDRQHAFSLSYLNCGMRAAKRFIALLPAPNCFIIFRVCRNCFRRRFTSSTPVPLPFAMRFRRFAFSTDGSRRSCGVME